MTTRRSRLLASALTAAAVLAATSPAAAHTDSDLVAVPAGEEAVVRLKPTHGCGDSPTTEVAIRVPVTGARPVDVPGWTASATDDGAGRTVVEWKGGSLPVDQTGSFPVEFTAPGAVGNLLLFPAVQVCANGEELSWLSGDPAADYPAPRLLVLPPGSAPATTIDEVPADAPGRDQIAEIVAVPPGLDASTTTTTTAAPPNSTDTDPEVAASAPATTTSAASETTSDDPDGVGHDGPNSAVVVLSAVAFVGVAVLAGAALRRRRRSARGPIPETYREPTEDLEQRQ